MPGKTRNGGKMLKDRVSLNSSDGDSLTCSYCNKVIPFRTDRENRVDCEGDSLETYHLRCYDLALFGRVMTITKQKMERLGIE